MTNIMDGTINSHLFYVKYGFNSKRKEEMSKNYRKIITYFRDMIGLVICIMNILEKEPLQK